MGEVQTKAIMSRGQLSENYLYHPPMHTVQSLVLSNRMRSIKRVGTNALNVPPVLGQDVNPSKGMGQSATASRKNRWFDQSSGVPWVVLQSEPKIHIRPMLMHPPSLTAYAARGGPVRHKRVTDSVKKIPGSGCGCPAAYSPGIP
jgi:hypothetical protein